MSTGRVLWVIWCLAWAGLWAVLSVLAWTGVAAPWQLILFPLLAGGSAGAIGIPVGTSRSGEVDPSTRTRLRLQHLHAEASISDNR